MENLNFIAIDCETAYHSREECEICSIGIVVVENGLIVEKCHHYIKPKYNFIDTNCQKIHNIKIKDVIDKPTFPELWPTIEHYFEDTTIICHNKGAELSYLSKLLINYDLDIPSFKYIDSYHLFGCDLPDACKDLLDIDIQKVHHNALEDAIYCAKCCIQYFNRYEDFNTLSDKYYSEFSRQLAERIYNQSLRKIERRKLSNYIRSLNNFSHQNIFANQYVYLSGDFDKEPLKSKILKAEIHDFIIKQGGSKCNKVDETTTLVILGERPYKYDPNSKSCNHQKAEELNIKCIKLDDFLKELQTKEELYTSADLFAYI